MPSAIELFSGCGGLSTGLIAAGFEVLSAVEINQTAADTYGLNHPTVNLIVDDVRNVTAVSLLRRHNLRIGELDLLAGCSPCQGFSRLRKGESGSTDPRNQLVLEFLRLVRGLRPKTVFMENVPGLITTEYGEKLFKEILAELTRLGYTVDYRVVDTADYGVPQFRKRFVLLGSRYKRHPIELPEVTHASPEVSVRQNKLAWNTVRTAFAGIPELQNGGTDPNIPLHINKSIDRIKKLCEYIGADLVFSGRVSEAVTNYALEEEKFGEFAEKARLIRDNQCDKEDFERFVDSVSINLSNRSLYELQLLSAYHLAFSQNACNFSVPGAGKTSVVYGAFAYLSNLPQDDIKYVDRLLIISPLSAFGPWELEYEECFGKKPSTKRLNGKVPIEEKKQYLYSLNPAKITLLSYASVPSLKEELIYFLRNNRVMVVLDEAHKIKNTSGGVTAAGVLEIAAYCSSRVVLTGTPAPNGYEDLYNLYKFIWPTKKIIPFEVYQLKDMSKAENDPRVDTLLRSIEPFFIRVKKSDLGIPQATEHEPIVVPMGETQRRIYDVYPFSRLC